ncbi:MAG: hypothetical protein NTW15_21570 [Burkholderiales bacterium]|nr:hypothetical protein [Burkholderiales bacterium]
MPEGPGLLRSLGRLGLVAAGAVLTSSGGELALLQLQRLLQGKEPLDVDLGQWQRAGSAFERWNPQWKLSASATSEQAAQAVRRAAELDEQLAGGRITPQTFRLEMGRLARTLQDAPVPPAGPPAAAPRPPGPPQAREPVRQPPGVQDVERLQRALQAHQAAPTARTRGMLNDELARTDSLHGQHGARWPAETAALYGALQARARSALAQPLVSERASEVVQQLGRAIRACNARPTDPAGREALNDVFALAKSLHANRHDWTPATRRNFDALAPQAVRTLYGNASKAPPAGLPARRSETTHTRGTGAQTGAGAAELEQRARAKQAQALEQATLAVNEGRRTLLPDGSVEALARVVYAQRGGARALGVSVDAFVQQVQRPGMDQGTDAGGRVRAGHAGGGATPPGSGPSGHIVHRQKQQEPQQAQRHREAESEGEPAAFRAAAYLRQAGQPSHLAVKTAPSDEVSIGVDRSRLVPEARAAHDRLVSHLGPEQLERLLGVLIAGRGGEVGLHALGEVWRTSRPDEPLSGRTLRDLGQVLTNWSDYGTLDDLAALTEFRAGTYRGIYPPTEAHAEARGRIAPHLDGLVHMEGLSAGPPTLDELLRAPWVLQHLRSMQLAYDHDTRGDATASRGIAPAHWRWPTSTAPGFAESAAALEAFWLTLRAASATGADPAGLSNGENVSWGDAEARIPGLRTVDFTVFPAFHRAVRDGFRAIMREFDPLQDVARVGIAAHQIARATFAGDDLRTRLYESLAFRFADPRAVRAFAATPQFEATAQRLVLERLDERVRAAIRLPWGIEGLHQSALRWAEARAGTSSSPPARLRALESLLTDPALGSERSLLEMKALGRDMTERRMLAEIRAPGLAAVEPGSRPSRAVPRSIHEAICDILARYGIEAEVRPGVVPEFIVDGSSTGADRKDRERNVEIARWMSATCQRLAEWDYPSAWRFRPDTR